MANYGMECAKCGVVYRDLGSHQQRCSGDPALVASYVANVKPYERKCPTCGAWKGDKCRENGRTMATVHPERIS